MISSSPGLSLFLFLFLLWSAQLATAQASSLLLGVPGGRAGSIGGAFCAIADDAEAVFYNPAGLGIIRDPEAGVMYTSRGESFFSKNHFISADLFFPADKYGIGVGLLYENRDDDNSHASCRSACAVLSTGSKVVGRIALGFGARYLWSRLESSEASAVGGDMGVLVNLFPVFVGFSLQNWQGALDYGDLEEEPPDILRFSIGYKEPGSGSPLAIEYRRVIGEEASTVNAGIEVPAVREKVHLRAGYLRETDSGDGSFVVGFGVRLFEQEGANSGHPLGFELNVYDNLSAGGLHDLRLELRRRRI